MVEALRRWLRCEKGQGMVEYGLILALVAAVVMGALLALGTGIRGEFDSINDNITQVR